MPPKLRWLFLVSAAVVLFSAAFLVTRYERVSAQDITVAPMTATIVVAADAPTDGPQAGLRRMSRQDRKLAREVRNDAAEALDMRRLEFMRAAVDGDQDAIDQLKLSLAERDEALRWDPDDFDQFLTRLLEFFKQLMAIFAMFAYDIDLPPIVYVMVT